MCLRNWIEAPESDSFLLTHSSRECDSVLQSGGLAGQAGHGPAVAHLHRRDRRDAGALKIAPETANVRFSEFDLHGAIMAKPLASKIGGLPEMLAATAPNLP